MKLPSLEQLEERIGYHFQDTYLLSCALTHSSWANEQKIHRYKDYERLEFLGDAVLEMLSSAFLFHEYPDMREGELSKRRAALVCEPSLAECARRLGIEQHIRLGRGAEADGGREKDSIVSDVMEALIGAMYLDSGSVPVVREFVMTHILADAGERHLFYDAKSILQEIVQKTPLRSSGGDRTGARPYLYSGSPDRRTDGRDRPGQIQKERRAAGGL